MSATVTETRAGCTATRHDTSSAYKRNGCRCPLARKAEMARKAKYDRDRTGRRGSYKRCAQLAAGVKAGVPPFHTDPRRGCADLDNPDVMFPDKVADIPASVAICRGCPFRQRCAEWALDTGQIYGVYGGVAPADRRAQLAARQQAGA